MTDFDLCNYGPQTSKHLFFHTQLMVQLSWMPLNTVPYALGPSQALQHSLGRVGVQVLLWFAVPAPRTEEVLTRKTVSAHDEC